MKSVLILCVLFSVGHVNSLGSLFDRNRKYDIPPPIAQERRDGFTSTKSFSQQLDHYDPTNKDTWLQRYFVNTRFHNTIKKNVAFILIGGEGDASISWMSNGAWVVTAQKYGALMFQLEHRFYGESQPFSDLSLENLRYLSSEQALADLANFITAMNKEYELSSDVKWIAFGGSYSGSLAAWLRMKYPHIVHGAMSSSGPLFAQLEFSEYLQVVADDVAAYSQECLDTVKTAINQVDNSLKNPGDENITSLFNLCDDIYEDVDSTLDIANFFGSLVDNFAGVAQYNKDYGRNVSIDDLCAILTDKSLGKEINRLVEVHKLSHTQCLHYRYQHDLQNMLNVTIVKNGNGRQWYYQTCTEYGWYQTTNQENHVFGNWISVDFYTKFCTDLFGELFNKTFITDQTKRTNTDYGGYDIDVTNVVFVHGSFDPWHPLGLLETRNPDAPVIYINGTAHCANFYNATKDDLPELTAAREEVDRLIGVWLGVITNETELSAEEKLLDTASSGNGHLPLSLMSIIICITLINELSRVFIN